MKHKYNEFKEDILIYVDLNFVEMYEYTKMPKNTLLKKSGKNSF